MNAAGEQSPGGANDGSRHREKHQQREKFQYGPKHKKGPEGPWLLR
jgi:hypothetical protein